MVSGYYLSVNQGNHYRDKEGVEMIVRINGKEIAPAQTETKIWRQEKPGLYLYSTGLAGLIFQYQDMASYITAAVICFAGTAWMFGHRTQAIERLIGAGIGLYVILHVWDIIKFIKGL